MARIQQRGYKYVDFVFESFYLALCGLQSCLIGLFGKGGLTAEVVLRSFW